MPIPRTRLLSCLAMGLMALMLALATPALAQSVRLDDETAIEQPRDDTGGAQTLEDILRRQDQLEVDDSFRSGAIGDPSRAKPTTDQLGTLGGISDAELWRAYRYNEADLTSSSRVPASNIVIQDTGMKWLDFRAGPLRTYGGFLLLGMIALLAVFFLIRGRIRIDGEPTGRTVLRFKWIERFAHWMLAGSFILLALTGLWLLFGRVAIIPLLGKEIYATGALWGKWVHNNVAWPFMIALVMVIVMWIGHNIPAKHDLKWLAQAGGLFSKNVHPPAKKFNAGQKLIFWSVVILGISISVSGLSLIFPFELSLFDWTFAKLNAIGLPGLVGLDPLPVDMTPHLEMQLAQAWHAIIGFIFMAIVIAHIYIGSVGMEGAFDAMGTGEVEEQWAREHHGMWLDELERKGEAPGTPAE